MAEQPVQQSVPVQTSLPDARGDSLIRGTHILRARGSLASICQAMLRQFLGVESCTMRCCECFNDRRALERASVSRAFLKPPMTSLHHLSRRLRITTSAHTMTGQRTRQSFSTRQPNAKDSARAWCARGRKRRMSSQSLSHKPHAPVHLHLG